MSTTHPHTDRPFSAQIQCFLLLSCFSQYCHTHPSPFQVTAMPLASEMSPCLITTPPWAALALSGCHEHKHLKGRIHLICTCRHPTSCYRTVQVVSSQCSHSIIPTTAQDNLKSGRHCSTELKQRGPLRPSPFLPQLWDI